MIKKLNILTTLFVLCGCIYAYNNHHVSYKILHAIVSPFQNDYYSSTYYKFKVPDEWFFIRKDDDSSTFIGSTWNDKEEYTSAIVFTDFDKLEKYIHYFSKGNCKNIDANTKVKNTLLIKSKVEKSIESDGEIIFCNSDDRNNSYVAYSNRGAITTILVQPYSKKYQEQYIKLFENIDYIILEDQIPKWILEE